MPQSPKITITTATFPRDKKAVTSLFTAYTNALGLDLEFQDYESEINSLPGKYAPDNGGCLLVARIDDGDQEYGSSELLGCVAYRALSLSPLGDNIDNKTTTTTTTDSKQEKPYCEMKRLYLTPNARGTGIGTKLVEAIIQHAKRTQLYRGMKLDTLPSDYMASARALYKRYGFVEIERYYETPIEGTIFMGLEF